MFIKFSRGCIGLNIQNEEGEHLLIEPCDLNGPECWDPLGLHWRNMYGKGHEPLSLEKTAEMAVEMNRLIREGYAFRQVRNLLR